LRTTKPRREKLHERSANQRATHVQRYLFSISSTQTRLISRDEVPHSTEVSLHDILLHFNDADEVSCRAGAIKCSRCRASFAPILATFEDRRWFPRWVGNSPAH
jgi:hypothetical protein